MMGNRIRNTLFAAAAVLMSLCVRVWAAEPGSNPLTGDDSLIGAWITLMVLSAVGIVITVILLMRTPKK